MPPGASLRKVTKFGTPTWSNMPKGVLKKNNEEAIVHGGARIKLHRYCVERKEEIHPKTGSRNSRSSNASEIVP